MKRVWKALALDGAAEGKAPEEVVPDKQTFLSMPTKRRIATLALIALVFAGGMDFATKYYDVSAQSAQYGDRWLMIQWKTQKNAPKTISDFRKMAAADGRPWRSQYSR